MAPKWTNYDSQSCSWKYKHSKRGVKTVSPRARNASETIAVERSSDLQNGSLQIIRAEKNDSGYYVCEAINSEGKAAVTVVLDVKGISATWLVLTFLSRISTSHCTRIFTKGPVHSNNNYTFQMFLFLTQTGCGEMFYMLLRWTDPLKLKLLWLFYSHTLSCTFITHMFLQVTCSIEHFDFVLLHMTKTLLPFLHETCNLER